jgi:L-glyceraldehyde 3-phosphate reductase
MPIMPYIAHEERYDQIPYRRCGRSGIRLPAISLGLWHNFGHADSFANAKAIVLGAFDRGVTHFDLANNYGPPPGSAEACFGTILKQDLRPYRDELLISTKAGYLMWPGPYGEWGSRKYLLASLDQSLKRLGVDYVDIFYSHRPDPDTPLEETMQALHTTVQQGKALYVGLSNYSAEQTRAASHLLRQLGTPCLIHQPSYSLFNRWIEDGLQTVLQEEGIGTIAFSPLAQGMLTARYFNGIPQDSRVASSGIFLKEEDITADKVRIAKTLDQIAAQRGQSLAQMALAWVLRGERVTSALVGVSRLSQLEENLAALQHLEFSEEELQQIDNILQ